LPNQPLPNQLPCLAERRCACALDELDLSENLLGKYGCERLAAIVRTAAGGPLRKLGLRGNGLDDRCFNVIAHAVGAPKSRLEQLDVSNNRIGLEGIGTLCEELERHPDGHALTALNLSYNRVNMAVARRVARMLASDVSICKLDLRPTIVRNPHTGDVGPYLHITELPVSISHNQAVAAAAVAATE